MKQIDLNNGTIKVYDNLFNLKYRTFLYNYIDSSRYSIGWADTDIPEKQQYRNLHSNYDEEDLENTLYLKNLERVGILKEVEGLSLKKTVVNLTTSSDVHFIHSHIEKKVILYYANLDWQDGWYGETLFFEDNSREIVYASSYIPGRIIIFDGNIAHSIRPQSILATKFRFTLALFFD